MICKLKDCGAESGDNLVCDFCRQNVLRAGVSKKIMIEWHNIICEEYSIGDMCLCFHCGVLYPRNEVCGDHFPYTKGARPDLRFNVKNGRCCCASCNTSGNKNRKEPTEEDFKPFLPTQ